MLELPNNNFFRPSWDKYFMKIAHIVRQRSNCMKRRYNHPLNYILKCKVLEQFLLKKIEL